MTETENHPLADSFPPIPQRFLDKLLKYCDKESPAASILSGGTYLKRLADMGMLDLKGFCNELNYIFFTGESVLNPDLFGKHNINEIVEYIKERSALGGVLT